VFRDDPERWGRGVSQFGHIDLRVSDMLRRDFYAQLLPALGFTERWVCEAWAEWAHHGAASLNGPFSRLQRSQATLRTATARILGLVRGEG
jgi:hypothetical protein